MRLRRSAVRARREHGSVLCTIQACCCLGLLVVGVAADAGPREQARRIHDRLAGVPPNSAVLDSMEQDVANNNAFAAASTAMDNVAFYNVTLKNFATPWTNREQDVFAELNDYTATVVGMVRDDVAFNTLLSADILYTGRSGLGIPAYSMTNNDHYVALEGLLEQDGINLKDDLLQTSQSAVTDLPPAGIAGVMTTRAAAKAFFIAGTNRAMFRFTMLNHLCNDMEQVLDTTRPPDRIRQDVSRSPGGDSRVFLNNCIGCHTGMDGLAGGFAYFDYDEVAGRILYTPGQVQPKYFNNNETFKYGFITQDDSWVNYWRAGQNTFLGWGSGPGSGSGASSLGQELANTDAFARCQVKKVFRNVCFRDPVDAADRAQIDSMVASFTGGGYRMKQVFGETAVYCMGN
jgi:hypothetical protein